uniref:Protein ROOT INITIATION DEFECTIVE 3-like n=1 Tax=Nelumbo nucifera TaxID=4432 RepID=A0A822YIZ2_NELNU|nr:TPA_asm: hypothetical protein HUJ06_011348 [Nelumbo nucifera]
MYLIILVCSFSEERNKKWSQHERFEYQIGQSILFLVANWLVMVKYLVDSIYVNSNSNGKRVIWLIFVLEMGTRQILNVNASECILLVSKDEMTRFYLSKYFFIAFLLQPQVEVKSFPAEPIHPLISNSDGTYIIGGGSSGAIYFWEVASGRLLKRWHAHYRAATCLFLSDDESLLVSGAEDGCIRVWSLFMVFDDIGMEMAKHPYEYSFSEHTLRVTDVVSGYGGCNAIIVSASEDRTCKVWSLSRGKLLRSIDFPSIIDAVALDPGEHVFYAGARDGKIYIAALNAESTPSNIYGKHIIGSLSDNSKGVTCLAFSMDGILLVSGSEDGTIRVWDAKTRNIVRIFRLAKGPINNVLVVRRPLYSNFQTSANSHASLSRRHVPLLPPPLSKYVNSTDEIVDSGAITVPQTPSSDIMDAPYLSSHVLTKQISELQVFFIF